MNVLHVRQRIKNKVQRGVRKGWKTLLAAGVLKQLGRGTCAHNNIPKAWFQNCVTDLTSHKKWSQQKKDGLLPKTGKVYKNGSFLIKVFSGGSKQVSELVCMRWQLLVDCWGPDQSDLYFNNNM